MGENNNYDPGVYKRLQLVQKQFRTKQAEQRRTETAARRQRFLDNLRLNRSLYSRIAVYIVLGAVLLAVILTVILDKT